MRPHGSIVAASLLFLVALGCASTSREQGPLAVAYAERAGVVEAAAPAADVPSDGPTARTVYWCPMRGNPCDEVDYGAPGSCGTCGMALWTQARYVAYHVDLRSKQKTVGILLYPGFEVLDVYGPVEIWGYVPEFKLITVAEQKGLVSSTQGLSTLADYDFDDAPALDILLVPGGNGTLVEIENDALREFLRERHAVAEITTSVCSGSFLLARAGILDGRKATSNKLLFAMARQQSDRVDWIESARWVDDGETITSSGVSAGIDMALHLVARLYGEPRAREIAGWAEYVWNADPDNDPFAGRALPAGN
ncbi:MAG: DJ-1/PfpI family protein [Planctomycetota bacterium]